MARRLPRRGQMSPIKIHDPDNCRSKHPALYIHCIYASRIRPVNSLSKKCRNSPVHRDPPHGIYRLRKIQCISMKTWNILRLWLRTVSIRPSNKNTTPSITSILLLAQTPMPTSKSSTPDPTSLPNYRPTNSSTTRHAKTAPVLTKAPPTY